METKRIQFTEQAKTELQELLTHYPQRQAATLPAIMLASREFGYVDDEIFEQISLLIDIPVIHIKDTASFYTMFLGKGAGRNVIMLCHTLSCALRGAAEILAHIKKKLGIEVGETTPDNKFTLLKCECLASCGTAPAMSINGKYYENLTIEKVDEIFDGIE